MLVKKSETTGVERGKRDIPWLQSKIKASASEPKSSLSFEIFNGKSTQFGTGVAGIGTYGARGVRETGLEVETVRGRG